jgi:hypothetical protein
MLDDPIKWMMLVTSILLGLPSAIEGYKHLLTKKQKEKRHLSIREQRAREDPQRHKNRER